MIPFHVLIILFNWIFSEYALYFLTGILFTMFPLLGMLFLHFHSIKWCLFLMLVVFLLAFDLIRFL